MALDPYVSARDSVRRAYWRVFDVVKEQALKVILKTKISLPFELRHPMEEQLARAKTRPQVDKQS